MTRLWIADVHANLAAFEAVLADAGTAEEMVYLGDIVGFGPRPAECVELLMHLDARAVRGNHDASMLAIRKLGERHANPRDWDEWTFNQLSVAHLVFLEAFPAALEVDFCRVPAMVTHHPAGAPYLHPDMPDAVYSGFLEKARRPTLICGHSHREIDRMVNGRRYVCIPSIGQPRNGDPRAGYAIECDGAIEFRYVAYDVERTVRETAAIGLDEQFLERWLKFLRTGHDGEWSRDYVPGKPVNKWLDAAIARF